MCYSKWAVFGGIDSVRLKIIWPKFVSLQAKYFWASFFNQLTCQSKQSTFWPDQQKSSYEYGHTYSIAVQNAIVLSWRRIRNKRTCLEANSALHRSWIKSAKSGHCSSWRPAPAECGIPLPCCCYLDIGQGTSRRGVRADWLAGLVHPTPA